MYYYDHPFQTPGYPAHCWQDKCLILAQRIALSVMFGSAVLIFVSQALKGTP